MLEWARDDCPRVICLRRELPNMSEEAEAELSTGLTHILHTKAFSSCVQTSHSCFAFSRHRPNTHCLALNCCNASDQYSRRASRSDLGPFPGFCALAIWIQGITGPHTKQALTRLLKKPLMMASTNVRSGEVFALKYEVALLQYST